MGTIARFPDPGPLNVPVRFLVLANAAQVGRGFFVETGCHAGGEFHLPGRVEAQFAFSFADRKTVRLEVEQMTAPSLT
jgi:hypothetical protein